MDSVDLNQFERAIEGRIADSELNAGCDGIPDGVRERFGSATWFQDSDYGKLATLDGLGEVFTLIGDVNAEKLILLTAGSFDAESALSFWEDHGGQIHGQLTDRDVIDVDGLPVHEIDGFIFAPISSARIARWYLESIQDVGVVASPRFVCVLHQRPCVRRFTVNCRCRMSVLGGVGDAIHPSRGCVFGA